MPDPTLNDLEHDLPAIDAYGDLPLDDLAYGDLDLEASYADQGGHPQPKENDDA